MGVDGERDVLRIATVGHRDDRLVDEMPGLGADAVDPEKLVAAGVGDHLHPALDIAARPGTADAAEREATHPHGVSVVDRLLLGQPDRGDLRMGEDYGRNGVVVHHRPLVGNTLGGDHAFVHGDVRQHRRRHDVTDRVDPIDRGAHPLVDGDEATFVELEAHGLEPEAADDIRVLKHVQSAEERRAAEEIANREKCPDFASFERLFEQVQAELDRGERSTRPFELKAEIRPGALFIVGGQIAYVAEMGDLYTTDHGRSDARLRVIFDNGTQSTMLMRSLQRALNKDNAGRRILDPEAGPLFSGKAEAGDDASGTIYVLRSQSNHPLVSEHRDLVHKIGVTNMAVEKRIAGARLQPTFLMADVDIVAEYHLFNINRTKLERLIHRVFGAAQIDITIPDRFGKPVIPQEWFLVPLDAIDAAVERLKDGSITRYRYEPKEARLVERD